MRKLTVALVLVALLTLPVVSMAGPPETIPPKPGTKDNPGLQWAGLVGYWMSDGASYIGYSIAMWLWGEMPPPWFVGK